MIWRVPQHKPGIWPTALMRDTHGAVTTEFVIIFPLVVFLVLFIVFVSLLIATASDVQQLAHELARSSISILNSPNPPADLCLALQGELTRLVDYSTTLKAANMRPLTACPNQPDAQGYVTISVTYGLTDSLVQSLGSNFRIDLAEITRLSTVKP